MNKKKTSQEAPNSGKRKHSTEDEKDNEVLGFQLRLQTLQKKRKIGCTSRRAQFIKKLWHMVNTESKSGNNVVYWCDQGTAFLVENMFMFASNVLQKYFDHKNLASFERQMNFYSFSKMAKDELIPTGKRFKKGAAVKFKHTYFRQDGEANLGLIVRKTCPMLHRNMESELEDLCHELKALKKERKALELKLRGLKSFSSTGKMEPAIKELLLRATKIWSKTISEKKAQKINVKKSEHFINIPESIIDNDTFYVDEDEFTGEENDLLNIFEDIVDRKSIIENEPNNNLVEQFNIDVGKDVLDPREEYELLDQNIALDDDMMGAFRMETNQNMATKSKTPKNIIDEYDIKLLEDALMGDNLKFKCKPSMWSSISSENIIYDTKNLSICSDAKLFSNILGQYSGDMSTDVKNILEQSSFAF